MLGLAVVPITPNAFQQQLGPGAIFLAKIASSLGAPVPIVSPTAAAFGNELVGVSSAAVDISVGNFGDSAMSPMISVTGDFSQVNTCSKPVVAGQKCDISVVFTPTVIGNRTGTMTVNFGGTIPAQTVALSGTGTVSAAIPKPGAVTFPPQAVGATSTSQQVAISNTGTGPLSVTSAQTTGDFAQTNACGAPVAPGSACLIQVTFTPTAEGVRNGVLTLIDNAPDSPQTVALTGTGSNASVSLGPTSLTFPPQIVSTNSAPQQVVLTNSGTGSLTISSLQTTGDFAQTNGCTTAIAAGSTCSMQITFTPTALGTRTGVLTINDSAPGTPHTMSLTGTGASLALGVAAGGSNSATIQAGGTASYSLSIGGAAYGGTASLSCSGAPTGGTCSVPSTVSISATSATAFSVTVTTTARMMASIGPFSDPRTPWASAFMGLLISLSAGRRKRGFRGPLWLAPLLLVLLWSSAGCGGDSGNSGPQLNPNGTPAGTYTLSVTATSGSVTQSSALTLVVQ